jgi:hypothetical protein
MRKVRKIQQMVILFGILTMETIISEYIFNIPI